MSEEEASVLFMPSGLRGQIPVGTTVLQAAQRLGVDLESICGGQGLCRKCQVLPQEGEFSKHGISSRAEHLSPLTETERHHQSKKRLKQGRRLGCNARILGDLVIDVPEESQLHRKQIAKAVTARHRGPAGAAPVHRDPARTGYARRRCRTSAGCSGP